MADSQPKAAPLPDLTGRTLGDFHILRRIGAGGMGQVYLARQMSLKREVALKLLRGELTTNPTALARFQAEAQAVAKLNHPNIVHIHQVGEADGLRYMVLEFVEGRNLRDYLDRRGPPDLAVTFSVMRQVALALQQAHEQGIVHRDIKPENILVTRKVEVKVTDFGLSRFFAGGEPAAHLTQSGVTLGTPLYMSPEQVQGHAVDHRSDIYSFGVTCYHLLSGEPPFRGTSAFDVALKHVQEHPRPLSQLRDDLPAELCAVVHKMMAKSPAQRQQSARDVLRDIQKVREGVAGANATRATPPAAGRPGGGAVTEAGLALTQSGTAAVAPPPAAGRWWPVPLACVLATGGGLCAFAVTHPARDPHPPAAAAAPAAPATPSQGLPEVRGPHRLTTARERELLAALGADGVKPDEVIRAAVELGRLYVAERRFGEAAAQFDALKARGAKWGGDPVAARFATLAGRLGAAVVLANENKAEASHKLFVEVVTEQAAKPAGPKPDHPRGASLNWLLLRHPELGEAVADALNRNLANLIPPRARLDPPALEQLRAAPRVGK